MADPKVPDALVMRELKYGAGAPTERDRAAADLVALGRRTEALLLYDGRAGEPGARALLEQAVREGTSFRLLSLMRMGAEVGPEQIRACAEAAERAQRWLDARSCYVALQDAAALQRIADHLPPSLKPPPPPPPPAPPAAPTSTH